MCDVYDTFHPEVFGATGLQGECKRSLVLWLSLLGRPVDVDLVLETTEPNPQIQI